MSNSTLSFLGICDFVKHVLSGVLIIELKQFIIDFFIFQFLMFPRGWGEAEESSKYVNVHCAF